MTNKPQTSGRQAPERRLGTRWSATRKEFGSRIAGSGAKGGLVYPANRFIIRARMNE
jgi:hypothetical protein